MRSGLPGPVVWTEDVEAFVTFVDETAARLPAGFTQQGKGLVVADVDHDGDLEFRYQAGPRPNASNGLEIVFCD